MAIVAALVWALTAMAAHGGSLSEEHHHVISASHEVGTALDAERAVTLDHPHLVDGSDPSHHPEQYAAAVLPRPATAVAALGVVMAMVVAVSALAPFVASGGRGPPLGLAPVVTGHDLLIRLCLSRR